MKTLTLTSNQSQNLVSCKLHVHNYMADRRGEEGCALVASTHDLNVDGSKISL